MAASTKSATFGARFQSAYGWLSAHPITLSASIVVIVASSLITIVDGVGRASAFYNRSFGRSAQLEKAVAQLRTEVQVDVFSDLLQARPVFRRTIGPELKEQVYVLPEAYVQVLSSPDDSVIAYTVTSRTHSFRPVCPYSGARLMVSTFDSALSGCPRQWQGNVGAHSLDYTEVEYLGNPGDYQSVVVGQNFAAPQLGAEITPAFLDAREGGCGAPVVRRFRSEAAINTCGVIDWEVQQDTPMWNLIGGVSYAQVRKLDERPE